VLAPEIGLRRYLKRLVSRLLFRVVDNPLTHAVLRALGARNGHRSRVSDWHYYLILRRHIVAGYHQARRESRTAGRGPGGPMGSLDRGEG
jgi:hypothetical protein